MHLAIVTGKVTCQLIEILIDTGSFISIVSKKYVELHKPELSLTFHHVIAYASNNTPIYDLGYAYDPVQWIRENKLLMSVLAKQTI